MKREILFRGKRIDNGEWVYGFYIESSKEHHLGKRSLIVTGDRSTTYVGKEFVEVIPETVGQYTGLKDKNDIKIFEGDIGKTRRGGEYEVIFDGLGWKFKNINGYPRPWSTSNGKSVEIIGNIHEK